VRQQPQGIDFAMNVLDFQKMKDEGRKISMVTCYDYSSARAVAESSIDCILVGDSLAMTIHGYPTTLSATTAMMALHTAAVARVLRPSLSSPTCRFSLTAKD